MGEASKLKVSVWSPFVPGTALILAARGSPPQDVQQVPPKELTDSSGLQKEVFGWRMSEDPFGGIVEPAEREKMRAMLLEALSITIDPTKRSVTVLKSFLDEATSLLNNGAVEWTGSQSASIDDEEERRVNPLLALVNHLSWLAEVYEEHPNISFTIR